MPEVATYSEREIRILPPRESTSAWGLESSISEFLSLLKEKSKSKAALQSQMRTSLAVGPGSEAGLLEAEETKVQELIFQVETSFGITCRAEIAFRLKTLFHDAKEEEPTNVPISLGSLEHFLEFMQTGANLKCPSITLSPDNYICVSWRPDTCRVFSGIFWPDGSVSFAIFRPNEVHVGKQIRISGTVTADLLKEIVTPHGVLDWISN